MANPGGPPAPPIAQGAQDPPAAQDPQDPPGLPAPHTAQVPYMLPLNWSHFKPKFLESQTKT